MRKKIFVIIFVLLASGFIAYTNNAIPTQGKVSDNINNAELSAVNSTLVLSDLNWTACDHDRGNPVSFNPESTGGYTYDQNDTHLHIRETTDTYLRFVGWYTNFTSIDGNFTMEFEGKAKAENQEATRLAMILFDNVTKNEIHRQGYIGSPGVAETAFIPFEDSFSFPGYTEFVWFFCYSDGFTQYHEQEFWIRNLNLTVTAEDPPIVPELSNLYWLPLLLLFVLPILRKRKD